MPNKKEIKLKYGCVKKLAADCRVSRNTVTSACKYKLDSDLQALIRKRAYELNYVRQF